VYRRFATAILLIPVVISLIRLGPWGLALFCCVVSLIGLVEFYLLLGLKFRSPLIWVTVVAGLFVWIECALIYQGLSHNYRLWPFLLLLFPIISILILYLPDEHAAFQTMSILFIGVLYIQVPFILFFITAFESRCCHYYADYQFFIPLGILLLLWTADSAAYLIGKSLGRTRLFPRISPAKTWEGFIGSLIITPIIGISLNIYLCIPPVDWRIVAVIITVLGLFGDLVESMLKRNVSAKDSSTLLPGHGGMLDRFDGLLIAMPGVFLYTYYL
jgi:phosphatidate cytidylyltransferase